MTIIQRTISLFFFNISNKFTFMQPETYQYKKTRSLKLFNFALRLVELCFRQRVFLNKINNLLQAVHFLYAYHACFVQTLHRFGDGCTACGCGVERNSAIQSVAAYGVAVFDGFCVIIHRIHRHSNFAVFQGIDNMRSAFTHFVDFLALNACGL